jgi:hypothetical protein
MNDMASIRKMRPLPVFATSDGWDEAWEEPAAEDVATALSDGTAEDLVRGDNNQF